MTHCDCFLILAFSLVISVYEVEGKSLLGA